VLDIPSISAIVAAAGVLIGVVYYILDMRHQTKVRKTDLIMRLYSTIGTKEFVENDVSIFHQDVEDIEGFMHKYGSFLKFMESPDYAPYSMYHEFFEGVGILLHKKLLDIELVDDLFSSPIILIWEKTLPITQAIREYFKRPQFSEWFEYLYNEMKKREQKLLQKGSKNG
jgi:hypothetical protein